MKLKGLILILAMIAGIASANAADYVWKNATSKTGRMSKSPNLSLTIVTASTLIVPVGGSFTVNGAIASSTVTNNMAVKLVTINISGTNYWIPVRAYK